MNSESDLSGSNKEDGSRGQKMVSRWLSDGRSAGLRHPNVALQPFRPHPYLPEITRQIILNTSDSESERFEHATSKSRDGNEPERSELSKKPRISLHGCLSDSSTKMSKNESAKSNSNCGPSSSKSSEPRHSLRFIPSPHPDMVQRYSSSSESAAESSSSRSNPAPTRFPYRTDSTGIVETAPVANPDDSGGKFIASSLLPSHFTFKTSSVTGNTKTPLSLGSVEIERNERMSQHHWLSVPSRPFIIDNAISRRSDDEPGGIRHTSSCFSVEPACMSNSNFGDCCPANHGIQQAFSGHAVNGRSEPVESKDKEGYSGNEFGPGDPRNGPPSFHSIHSAPASQPVVSHIKLEPDECGPRGVRVQDRLTLVRNPPSSQMSKSLSHQAPILDFAEVNPTSYAHPSNVHETFNVRPEQVRFDPAVPRRSAEGGPLNSRNIQVSSQTSATRQTSSFAGLDNSNRSYLASNAGSENRNPPGSAGSVPSNQSYIDINPRNSDYSNQERQISSESSSAGILMSLVHKKNKIAGSSYNSSTGQVHLLESVTENLEFCTTVLALRSITPSIVIVPSSGATRFVKELKAKIEGDQTLKDCQFQCLSPRYFAYGFARRTILESSLWEGCLTFRSEDAKKNAIVSNINLNDERLVCAFGGLLYYLSTGCPQLGAGMSPSPITSIQHMKLNNKLWLDTESFKNLQIFDPAEHPSSFKWSSANRDDGKSIFGLFERFCSSVGMTKLKSFLANPVNCRRTLEKRHEVMNFYLNHSNFNAVEALRSFASQMSSSSVIMSYLSSPMLRGGHWKHIYRHIYYTVSYAEVCRSHGDHSELFRELGSTIVDAVYSMAHNLERVVDLVNMESNETFVIKYGFHPPLDAAKEKFSRLKVAMDKVTPYEFDSVPPFITRIQMMYIPEMKFLLSIPYWAPDLSKDELNLPNLEFKFTANKTAFYKTRRCYELDELLGDAQTDIINEESMIIQSLRNYLKKHMHHIVGMAHKIAEIECIFALAKVAREERYSKPEILDTFAFDIRGGWHPLLDVPSSEVITNDSVSSTDTSLVKLVYGPNASGKSIYLKQVGLIMYLVHVGSYVPAVSARVGLFSRILARTTLEESVISMSSTMLSELKKLQDAVMGCAKDTLVILDEVGKGSTETNCIAIVTSAVNFFLSRGSDCPHVLISTHLSGINDFLTPPPHSDGCRNLLELLIMEYTVTEGEIVFLYKIRKCGPNGSFVFEVLENSEFAAPIVKTARAVLEALRTGENFLPYCETRIQRSHKYLNFIKKFVNIDMAKPGYLEKLQNKIQRYYEKPPYYN